MVDRCGGCWQYPRNNDRDPYAADAGDESLMFPVRFRMHGKHPKTLVLGVRMGEAVRACALSEFPETGRFLLHDELGGEAITLHVDADAQSGRVFDSRGEERASLIAYWFAWFAFHPETQRYTGDPAPLPIGNDG